MIFQNSNIPLFEELSKEHSAAENAVKEAETYNEEISIPALKEIRDAYHHLDIALQTEDIQKQEKELISAIAHCKRAYFDARECTFLHFMDNADFIRKRMGEYLFLLNTYIKDYSSHKESLIKAQNFFHTIKDLKSESREARYKECDEHI